MHIRLNNEITVLPHESMTLREVLRWRNISENGTAVAVNGQLAPRSQWDVTYFCENDDVVIISAAYGG